MAKLTALAQLVLVGAVLLMGAAAAPIPITAEGYGAAKIGMTESQVRAAGFHWSEQGAAGDDCKSVEVTGRPGLHFMFEAHRLTRVSLFDSRTIRTDRGLGIGSTERQVRAPYPTGLVVEPHAYEDPPAHYLTWWAQPQKRGVKYSTDKKGVVNEIDAGSDSISLVEGCA